MVKMFTQNSTIGKKPTTIAQRVFKEAAAGLAWLARKSADKNNQAPSPPRILTKPTFEALLRSEQERLRTACAEDEGRKGLFDRDRIGRSIDHGKEQFSVPSPPKFLTKVGQ
jgi:hypothetical protein